MLSGDYTLPPSTLRSLREGHNRSMTTGGEEEEGEEGSVKVHRALNYEDEVYEGLCSIADADPDFSGFDLACVKP